MLKFLQSIILGVEIKKENFTLSQLPAVVIIIAATILISVFTSFLDAINNIIESANAEGIHYLALSSFKLAFITTPIQLVIISLFTEIKDPVRKYRNAFVALLTGFVLVFVMISLLNNPLMQNVSGYLQFVLGIFPIITVILVRLTIRQDFIN